MASALLLMGQNTETVPPLCTVAELAAGTCAPAKLGTRVRISNSDSTTDTDCATGTGANLILCEFNGTNWAVASSGGGATSVALGVTGVSAAPPTVAELTRDWYCYHKQFNEAADLFVTGATNWILSGATASVAIPSGTGNHPPYAKLVNGSAVDNDVAELQLAGTGVNQNFFIGAGGQNLRRYWMDFFVRISELDTVAEDDSTMEEVDFFLGVANEDTTVMAGAVDFIGFLARDQDDDVGVPLRVVAASAGGAAGNLADGFSQTIGWTRLDAGLGDAEVDNNRAALKMGPGNWTRLSLLAKVDSMTTSGTGSMNVYVNGIETAGSPYTVTNQFPNGNLVPTLGLRNGEAAGRRLDIGWATWCREMRESGTGSYPRTSTGD